MAAWFEARSRADHMAFGRRCRNVCLYIALHDDIMLIFGAVFCRVNCDVSDTSISQQDCTGMYPPNLQFFFRHPFIPASQETHPVFLANLTALCNLLCRVMCMCVSVCLWKITLSLHESVNGCSMP